MKTIITAILTVMALAFLSPAMAAPKEFYGKHLCAYQGFTCVKIKRGDTWKKLFPDAKQREIVKRLNRTNTRLYRRSWIVVPDNLSRVTHMDMSPFPEQIHSTGSRHIIVKLSLHAFGAYDKNGRLVHWGPISGGKGWCPDMGKPCKTATGSFKVIQKKGPGCVSGKFPLDKGGGAKMPYCMHYYRGFALHGAQLPGYHASHGCIRMNKDDAKWLNHHFSRIGKTRVTVEK
ncbi:MAG: L,D-transpeptidase [Gammaproteobacteria bacterium]|nr:L,D-transpeptidase [Gammaproteobacteria bacterium]MCH9743661.1 L,D-transpeptidase [Gammaproteobacteria bacterium]